MKKIIRIFSIALIFLISFTLISCGKKESNNIKVIYTYQNEVIEEEIIKKGSTATLIDTINLEKDGYKFDNWYKDKDYEFVYDKNTVLNKDTYIYARYLKEIKVTYKYDNTILSEVDMLEGDIPYNNSIALEKNGYIFAGWCSDSNLTTMIDDRKPLDDDITLYAKYSKKYTITLDSNGGSAFSNIEYTELNNVSLPIPTKDGVMFSHWEDTQGNKYNYIEKGNNKDLSLTAIYKEIEKIDVTFTTKASNFEAGFLSSKLDGIYTLTAEVRPRIQTWTNPLNEEESITWDYSYKIGADTSNIKLTAPADGVLTFYVQNGSSNKTTQSVAVSGSNGDNKTYVFSGTTEAIAPYKAGSPVVKIEHEVKEGVTYTIKRTGGTIDIYEVNLATSVFESNVTDIIIENTGNTVYYEGGVFDPSNIRVSAVCGDNYYFKSISNNEIYVDTTNVNMYESGEYEVIVNYGQFKKSFNIYVYEPKGIEVFLNKTYISNNTYNQIYVNGSVKTIYELNEEFDASNITVKVKASYDDKEELFIINDNYRCVGFDNTIAGEQEIYVKAVINNKTYVTTYNVFVIDTNPYKNQNGEYMVTVDQYYEGESGVVKRLKGNMFTTIKEALEYLNRSDIPDSASKILNIEAGLFKEKLEINIPNLTIIGKGTCEATDFTNVNFDVEKYNNATIIEWDSLYGIEDESGFSQVTDSTATVAIRESAINCHIKNVTISNYWNCEEVFQKNIAYLREKGIAISDTINDHRALALIVQADKFTLESSSLLGYQDTVEFMTGRQVVINSYISGNTDFIFGTNSTTYFYKTQIHVNYKVGGAGYITAYKGCNKGAEDSIVYGFIFDQCEFTADSKVLNKFAIGRPWGAYSKVMVMNSNLGSHIGLTSTDRYVSMGGVNPKDETVSYLEYNNTGDGAISESFEGVSIVEQSTAANYNNINIIFNTTNGNMTYSDSWNPSIK